MQRRGYEDARPIALRRRELLKQRYKGNKDYEGQLLEVDPRSWAEC